jgi:hypothetical protein
MLSQVVARAFGPFYKQRPPGRPRIGLIPSRESLGKVVVCRAKATNPDKGQRHHHISPARRRWALLVALHAPRKRDDAEAG